MAERGQIFAGTTCLSRYIKGGGSIVATHRGPLRFEDSVSRTSRSNGLGCYRRVLEVLGKKAGALVTEDGTFEEERK